jgi:hypothetical protein
MHMLKEKRLVVLITANQFKALKAEHKATGASVGEIVRRAIEEYLKKK